MGCERGDHYDVNTPLTPLLPPYPFTILHLFCPTTSLPFSIHPQLSLLSLSLHSSLPTQNIKKDSHFPFFYYSVNSSPVPFLKGYPPLSFSVCWFANACSFFRCPFPNALPPSRPLSSDDFSPHSPLPLPIWEKKKLVL